MGLQMGLNYEILQIKRKKPERKKAQAKSFKIFTIEEIESLIA